jgi:hypothetical protein
MKIHRRGAEDAEEKIRYFLMKNLCDLGVSAVKKEATTLDRVHAAMLLAVPR